MNLSPAELLELEDHPETSGSLRMFAATVAGISASAVVVPIVLVLWFTALGRPGAGPAQAPEAVVAQIKASGKGGERTDAQLLAEAKRIVKWQGVAGRIFYRPLEFLLVSAAALLSAYFAALYIKADDIHAGKGAGSVFTPTLVGTLAGTVALWGLLYFLTILPAGHGGGHGGGHGTGPRSLSEFLADNAALADIVSYLGGTAVAALVAAATPRGSAQPAAADHHGHAAHAH